VYRAVLDDDEGSVTKPGVRGKGPCHDPATLAVVVQQMVREGGRPENSDSHLVSFMEPGGQRRRGRRRRGSCGRSPRGVSMAVSLYDRARRVRVRARCVLGRPSKFTGTDNSIPNFS
jgi:hypothetical protein